jgi:solute carrier family 35 protein E1
MEKFPDIDSLEGQSPYLASPIRTNGHANVPSPMDRRQPRQDSNARVFIASTQMNTGGRHERQKSLSDAIKTIRTRRASVSANVHEISDALKAPLSPKLIVRTPLVGIFESILTCLSQVLCIVWYMSSACTNTSSKSILTGFPKPATLTMVQFGFVAMSCVLFSWLSTLCPSLKSSIPALRQGIRYPNREIIMTTLPLAGFQIGGHLLSANATERIPVSLVHTIKGLSPLFTVFAYRTIFDINYPIATYISLIPLTLGVMLACAAEFKGNVFGIIYALLAALVFVTQNIFSKRLFNAEESGHQRVKLDKLNLLCYSSGLAFLLTSPIWFWSEGASLVGDFLRDGSIDLKDHPKALDHGRLALEFVFNGTFHFGQNIIAFILLSMVSPVSYSVASLFKRVFIVVVSIVWTKKATTKTQWLGIALTFFGLYLYDRSSGYSKADRKAKLMDIKEESILPITNKSNGSAVSRASFEVPYTNGYALNSTSDDKKIDESGGQFGHARGSSAAAWLPPGTRQEETWTQRELSINGTGNRIVGS